MPKLPKMPKVPKVSMPKMPKMPKMENMPLIGKKTPKPEPQAAGGGAVEKVKAKASLTGGGTVEFRGFNSAALQDFRVIPEDGAELFIPQNQVYGAVDGFWWRPQRGLWFKIPNHCSVVIKAASDPVIRSAFTTSSETGKVGAGLQMLRGKAIEPRFYPDAGATAHPTDYPFPIDKPASIDGAGALKTLSPGEEEASAFLAP
ncbi:MAG: hypothetical protein R3F19_27035 [Verrucomicrobiales bacterium]